ncbi:SusC/RagA family TonB-linked outer membrane protein [Sphingobacterium hotanense]|uniref:TonB-dependent receptor n=1 Tax=Sphingobacterium hotanense TaxID=649196 RepID=A0ABT7NS69_9SPHI|nr:TonB-dependent receptor [Sphingobacterium hotanense]MDM1050073.1 TonB-dependent receptor [Sphingobacterium hotanense]
MNFFKTKNLNFLLYAGMGFLCSQAPARAESVQKISIDVRNERIVDVFKQIKEQSNVSYLFDGKFTPIAKSITLKANSMELRELLPLIFQNQPFGYDYHKGVIVVREKTKDSQTRSSLTHIQEFVSGFVVNETGEALGGATVQLADGSKTVMTDAKGYFNLAISAETVSVRISYTGYETKTVILKQQEAPRIILNARQNILDETIVVGYGVQKKALVTSAVGSLKVDDSNMRQVASPTRLLEGRIAGVNVSMGSGNLASGERISIRGTSSISAGNNPLYVVDGVPINTSDMSLFSFGENYSPLAAFNHADIESIEILKDAASAAIYGSRASNGVVLITTKSGKAGRNDVRVNITTGFSEFANRNKIKLTSSQQYVNSYNAGVDNYNKQFGLAVGQSDYKIRISNPYEGLPDTDWLGLIVQKGYFQNYDASFSGGNTKTNYYFGLGLTDQSGVIKNNAIRKYNLNSKISHKFSDWLEIGANNMGNFIKNNQVPGANLGSTIIARAIEQRPFDRPFKPNGDYYVGGTDELTRHNPLQILNEQDAYVDNYRYLGTYYGQASFLDHFSFRTSFSADIGYTYDYTYYNDKHPYGTGVGRIIDYNRLIQNLVFDNVLNYNNSFGDLTVSAMLGHSFQKQMSRSSMIDGRGFPTPSMQVISVASEIFDASGSIGEYALESYFGRGTFSFQDKYLMTATFRADGSSKFHRDNRWGYFPSISFGWNVSREEFMGDNTNDLKIRASYGITGNQEGIGQYAYQALMSGGQNYGNISGISVSSFGNKDLRWERANQYDAGFDISFFKRRLNISFDAYYKKTFDLLYSRPIHATTGVTSIVSNIGTMENKGLELSINTNVPIGQVVWKSDFNIAHNKNKILSLLDDELPIAIGDNRALQVGKSIGAYYIFDWDGLYQYDGEVPQEQFDLGVRAGDVRWRDMDGNNIINDNDRIVTGDSNPKLTGGWNNSFSYKGFQLDMMFTFMYGTDIYAQWKSTGMANLGSNYAKDLTYVENAWTGPGTTNVYPRALIGLGHNTKNSTRFLEDGSFIRLRALTLGYNFDKSLVEQMKLKGLRVFATADNLFLLTRYSGWDPEVNNNLDPRYYGVDLFGVPQPRTFSFGLNVNL